MIFLEQYKMLSSYVKIHKFRAETKWELVLFYIGNVPYFMLHKK